MNIIYLPSDLYPCKGYGGAAIVSYEIITRLAKNNSVLILLSGCHRSKPLMLKNLTLSNVIALPNPLTNIFPLSQVVQATFDIQKFKPDIVISQYHPSDLISYAGRVLSKLAKTPLIVRSDDIWFVPFKRFGFLSHYIHKLNVKVIKESKYFLVNSTEHKIMVKKLYGQDDNIVIHPNGVDIKRFTPSIDTYVLKYKLGLEDKNVVLYSGSVAWFYCVDLLIKAFSLVAKEVKDTKLVFLGLFDGQKQILRELERNNVRSKAIMLPRIPYESIHKYIALGDVCVGTLCSLPVNLGTVPTKVPQYMACGKPTIVARRGVSRDLIINGETGITFWGGYKELADKIITLLQDRGLSKKIGDKARKHVEINYDWDKLVLRLQLLIHDAVA